MYAEYSVLYSRYNRCQLILNRTIFASATLGPLWIKFLFQQVTYLQCFRRRTCMVHLTDISREIAEYTRNTLIV